MVDVNLKVSMVERKKKEIPPHIVEMGLSMVYIEPMDVDFDRQGNYVLELVGFDERVVENIEVDSDVSCVIISSDEFSGGDVENVSVFKQFHTKPVLVKDVFVDEYQVLLSRVYLADGIIMSPDLVDLGMFERLFHLTVSLGMLPVLDVGERSNLERVKEVVGEVCVFMENGGNYAEIVRSGGGLPERRLRVVKRGM